ncbi:conserved hypothetical protein [Pseudomonas sp. OF001]|nr:conserved hypothetical protein [Pseudomonas sp. OF001]
MSEGWHTPEPRGKLSEGHELPDKLTEKQMAEWLGSTVPALSARRRKGKIPEGVWNREGTKLIWYSRKRYEEWREAQWVCPPGWRSGAALSASDLSGTVNADTKRSPSPRRKRASPLHPVFAIK